MNLQTMNPAQLEYEISREIWARWDQEQRRCMGLEVSLVPFSNQTTLCVNFAISPSPTRQVSLEAGRAMIPAIVLSVGNSKFLKYIDWLQIYLVAKAPLLPKEKLLRLDVDQRSLRRLAEDSGLEWSAISGVAKVEILKGEK